jgi:predicted RNA-binding protein with TRAM domain
MTRPTPPVRAGDEHTLEIVDLAFGGQGVARVSGFVVFVDDALPDELVRVRIRRVRHGHAEAECLEIVRPSSLRVAPPCRYFGECGGCDLQHLAWAGQAESKRRQVAALLERVAGMSDPPVREVEGAGDPLQYRFRVDFDWGATRDGGSGLGLHRSGHPADIVPVETCLLVPEVANRIRAFLERRAAEKGLTPRDPRRRRGLMRRAGIQMARTARTYSRIQGPAGDQGRPYRRSICALTCVPSPRMKRPPESACRSQAFCAITIGLRGKAIVTAVPSSIVRLCSAAISSGKKPLCCVSGAHNAPKPSASAA